MMVIIYTAQPAANICMYDMIFFFFFKVVEMPEHNPGDLGGTMRLGKRRTIFKSKNSILSKSYLRGTSMFSFNMIKLIDIKDDKFNVLCRFTTHFYGEMLPSEKGC